MRIFLTITVACGLTFYNSLQAFAADSDAIVRLSSKRATVCATGFFVDGGSRLVTNAHVTESLCPAGVCNEIQIERSVNGQFVPVGAGSLTLQVDRVFPSIDVAEIAMPPDFRSETALNFSAVAPNSGDATTMIGFPSCGAERESKGTVSHLDSISFDTSAEGASGSSGSPILDSHGKVFGIAFEADSLLRASYDKFFGGSFDLRAIRVDTLLALREDKTSTSRLAETQLLLNYYAHDLQASTGLNRIFKVLFFLNRVKTLAKAVTFESSDPALLRSAAILDNFPGIVLQTINASADSAEDAAFSQLVFASNLESRGPFIDFTEPLTKDGLQRALTEKKMPQTEIDQFLALLPDQKTAVLPGLIPFATVMGLMGVMLAVVLIFIYGGTLGYVYAKTRGGIIQRFLITCAVAVCLWPLSLIVLRIKRDRPAL